MSVCKDFLEWQKPAGSKRSHQIHQDKAVRSATARSHPPWGLLCLAPLKLPARRTPLLRIFRSSSASVPGLAWRSHVCWMLRATSFQALMPSSDKRLLASWCCVMELLTLRISAKAWPKWQPNRWTSSRFKNHNATWRDRPYSGWTRTSNNRQPTQMGYCASEFISVKQRHASCSLGAQKPPGLGTFITD